MKRTALVKSAPRRKLRAPKALKAKLVTLTTKLAPADKRRIAAIAKKQDTSSQALTADWLKDRLAKERAAAL